MFSQKMQELICYSSSTTTVSITPLPFPSHLSQQGTVIPVSSYHQGVSTGLQRGQADAEDDDGGKSVVVDKSSTVSVSMATVEGQVRIGVSREENRTEVDLESDGLHATVHADVSLG